MDDSALNTLITMLPARSIVLIEDIDVAFTRSPVKEKKTPSQQAALQSYGLVPYMTQSLGEGVTLAGLLGAIDGVAAQEGRILFATTNRYHVLDSALKRPGRLDIHFEFKEASRKQAEELFKRFYPASIPSNAGIEQPLADLSTEEISEKVSEAPKLTESELSTLAECFADLIPEREFSMATIQGHLMLHKTEPYRAVEETSAFVEQERKQRIEERKARERESERDREEDKPQRSSEQEDEETGISFEQMNGQTMMNKFIGQNGINNVDLAGLGAFQR